MTAIIFDVDGTLVDNNVAHIEAWRRAFARFGVELTRAQIEPMIGTGGDLLVPALIGEVDDRRVGDGIRRAHERAYLTIAQQIRFPPFPGVQRLLKELRDRRIATAVATSSKRAQLQATLTSARLSLGGNIDVLVDADAVPVTKPEPDLLAAAVALLGRTPDACLFVGDTVHDAEAARRANVRFVGLTCGGTSKQALKDAGASFVFRDAEELLVQLDNVLGEGVGVSLH